jgi:hypothetical protein
MPQSWDLSRHIQLAVLLLILIVMVAFTMRADFWDEWSSGNTLSKDVEEVEQNLAKQQEAIRIYEENQKLAKLKEVEGRRAVLEPGTCTDISSWPQMY